MQPLLITGSLIPSNSGCSGPDPVFLTNGPIAAAAAKAFLPLRSHLRKALVVGHGIGVMRTIGLILVRLAKVLVLMLHRVHMMIIGLVCHLVHWHWWRPKMLLIRIMLVATVERWWNPYLDRVVMVIVETIHSGSLRWRSLSLHGCFLVRRYGRGCLGCGRFLYCRQLSTIFWIRHIEPLFTPHRW